MLSLPCKSCLVEPVCSDECLDYLKFINSSADKLSTTDGPQYMTLLKKEVSNRICRLVRQFSNDRLRYTFNLDGETKIVEYYHFPCSPLTEKEVRENGKGATA
jgi:hypothetical protein